MKIWLVLDKKYELTLANGERIIGVTKFYRTPNTDDYLPIVLAIDGGEVQIDIANVRCERIGSWIGIGI